MERQEDRGEDNSGGKIQGRQTNVSFLLESNVQVAKETIPFGQ
jgi:hypothetical protein